MSIEILLQEWNMLTWSINVIDFWLKTEGPMST